MPTTVPKPPVITMPPMTAAAMASSSFRPLAASAVFTSNTWHVAKIVAQKAGEDEERYLHPVRRHAVRLGGLKVAACGIDPVASLGPAEHDIAEDRQDHPDHHTGIKAGCELVAEIVGVPVDREIREIEDRLENVPAEEVGDRTRRTEGIDIGARDVDVGDLLGNRRRDHEGVDLVADGFRHHRIAGFDGVLKRPLERLDALCGHDLGLCVGHPLGGVGQTLGQAGDSVGRHILEDRQQIGVRQSLGCGPLHLAMPRHIDDVLDVGKLGHGGRALGLVRAVVEGPKRHLGQAAKEEQAAKRHDEGRQARAHHDVALKPAEEQREAHGDHDRADGRYVVYIDEREEFDMHAPLKGNIDHDGKAPSQDHGHAGTGETDHRSDRQVEFARDNQQSGAKRDDAELRDDPQIVTNTKGIEAFPGKRVQRKFAGWDRKISKHAEEKQHHADGADFRPRQQDFSHPLDARRSDSLRVLVAWVMGIIQKKGWVARRYPPDWLL